MGMWDRWRGAERSRFVLGAWEWVTYREGTWRGAVLALGTWLVLLPLAERLAQPAARIAVLVLVAAGFYGAARLMASARRRDA